MAKRVLMYARGNGLGHLRRSRNIALALQEQDPECSVLILADHPSAPFFEPVSGIDVVKIPSRPARRDRDPVRYRLTVDDAQLTDLREQLILKVFREFNPDILLVDHRPVGDQGELKPVLEEISRRSSSLKLYLGVRDIDSTPEANRRKWSALGAYDYLPLYDGVLVYGSADIFDTDSAYELSSYVRRVVYCNFVAPPDRNIDPLTWGEEPILLAVGGSGQESVAMETAFVQALPLIKQEIPLQPVILMGPGMDQMDRRSIEAEVQRAGCPVQVIPAIKDATDLSRRAGLIITMGGYNSLCEVLRYRKKSLVTPRPVASFEQRIRTQALEGRGLIRSLSPEDLTAKGVSKALIGLYQADDIPNPVNMPKFDGARRAAAVLLGGE